MKNLIVVMATCLLWSVAAKADYNGYHIQFTIEYKNGKSNTGYAYVAAGYFNTDSLKSTSYLLTALDQNAKGISENDSLVYFKHRLKYNFQIPGDTTNEKFHIYYLTGLSSVAFKAVKALTIDTLIDFGYGTTIASALSIADLSWMKTKPKASYVFGGYLCWYRVFIHQPSEATTAIIKELKQKQKQIDQSPYEDDAGNIDYDKADAIDDSLLKVIQKLYRKKKVVVIAECSC